jgi:hypothetical protein
VASLLGLASVFFLLVIVNCAFSIYLIRVAFYVYYLNNKDESVECFKDA